MEWITHGRDISVTQDRLPGHHVDVEQAIELYYSRVSLALTLVYCLSTVAFQRVHQRTLASNLAYKSKFMFQKLVFLNETEINMKVNLHGNLYLTLFQKYDYTNPYNQVY